MTQESQTEPILFWFLSYGKSLFYYLFYGKSLWNLHFWDWQRRPGTWEEKAEPKTYVFSEWMKFIHHTFSYHQTHQFQCKCKFTAREKDRTESRVPKSVAKILGYWHSLFSREAPQPINAFHGVQGPMKRIIITSFALWQSSVNSTEGPLSGDDEKPPNED